MKSVTEFVKYCIATIIKGLWSLLSIFTPIKKNRILFDSYTGKQYSCNPRFIYEHMLDTFPADTEYIWAFRSPEKFSFLINNDNTTLCKYRSLKHYYYCMTSNVIIYNFTRTNELPVRKQQVRIQTWHGGGCYKRAGLSIGYNSKIHNWILNRKAKDMTHFISSSEYFSEEVIRLQYGFKGDILPIGMPRNDMLIHNDNERARKIRKNLGFLEEAFIVLYAPTFRDLKTNKVYESLNCIQLKQVIKKKFGQEAVILYRGHHFENESKSNKFDYNVSDYPDMQDLLLITNILITDYSSSIWDFSFTKRPCFLFTPDLADYREYRGFDKEIEEWGFPICCSNYELKEKIGAFDIEMYKRAMEKHHLQLGNYERGYATKAVCDLIIDKINK